MAEPAESVEMETPHNLTLAQTGRKSSFALMNERIKNRNELPDSDKKEINAWVIYDWANSVFFNTVLGSFLGPLILQTVTAAECPQLPDGFDENNCTDLEVNTIGSDCHCSVEAESKGTQVFLIATAISVVIQLILFFSLGAVADWGSLRKKLFVRFSMFSSISIIFLGFFLNPEWASLWWLIFPLLIMANSPYGYAIVLYNSFLPLLIDADPEVRKTVDPVKKDLLVEQKMSELSTRGYVWGYVGGLVLIVINIVIAVFIPSPLNSRINIMLAGIWYTLFSLPTWKNLKDRTSPELPAGETYLSISIRSYKSTFKKIKHLRETFKFLVVYFIFSDGYNTISTLGATFAASELDQEMSSLQLGFLLLDTQVSALIGNIIFLRMQKLYGYKPKQILVFNLMVIGILPFYGMLSFIPGFPYGLRKIWEMYAFGFVFGLNIGSVQSYGRTLFAQLTPPGHESEFFSLFEITDKGSSVLGPIIIAIATYVWNIRLALIYVALATIGPALYLSYRIDVKKGIKDCSNFHAIQTMHHTDIDSKMDTNLIEKPEETKE